MASPNRADRDGHDPAFEGNPCLHARLRNWAPGRSPSSHPSRIELVSISSSGFTTDTCSYGPGARHARRVGCSDSRLGTD